MIQVRSARVTSSATAKVAAPREQDLRRTTASGFTINPKLVTRGLLLEDHW